MNLHVNTHIYKPRRKSEDDRQKNTNRFLGRCGTGIIFILLPFHLYVFLNCLTYIIWAMKQFEGKWLFLKSILKLLLPSANIKHYVYSLTWTCQTVMIESKSNLFHYWFSKTFCLHSNFLCLLIEKDYKDSSFKFNILNPPKAL